MKSYKRNPDGTTSLCSIEQITNFPLKKTRLTNGSVVSTVFLGLDHNFTEVGDPVLWETMVFGEDGGEICLRYSSEEEAIQGHDRTVIELGGIVQYEQTGIERFPPPSEDDIYKLDIG